MENGYYESNAKMAIQASGAQFIPPTLTARLQEQKAVLEAKLAGVNEALQALAENPAVEKVMNLIQKASY